MKILALEFSSESRSVAVVEAGRVLGGAEAIGGRNTRAFSLIEAALRAAGLEREDIECLAVGLGPGSYTGIRVAISVAQGWQLASAVRVLGLDSAEAMARRAHGAGWRGRAHLLLDAQRGEFHCADVDGQEAVPRLGPWRLLGLEAARALPDQILIAEREWQEKFPSAMLLGPDAATLGLWAGGREDFVTADRLEPVTLRATRFVKAPMPRVPFQDP